MPSHENDYGNSKDFMSYSSINKDGEMTCKSKGKTVFFDAITLKTILIFYVSMVFENRKKFKDAVTI